MSHVGCPHCHTSVPFGAKVCTGCQAEVEYGAPKAAYIVSFFVAVTVGVNVAEYTHEYFGLVLFFVVVIGALYGSSKIFKNRVNFKRVYRTR